MHWETNLGMTHIILYAFPAIYLDIMKEMKEIHWSSRLQDSLHPSTLVQ